MGLSGEIGHPHAILHPKFGAPVRRALGGVDFCIATIPSTIKIGSVGDVDWWSLTWILSTSASLIRRCLTNCGRPNLKWVDHWGLRACRRAKLRVWTG
ncbi:MAG: amino acid synthesis family protein [Candidatus Jordarchaeaceae archaeon]